MYKTTNLVVSCRVGLHNGNTSVPLDLFNDALSTSQIIALDYYEIDTAASYYGVTQYLCFNLLL